MLAKDIRIGDIGKTFESLVYPNKNKTAKPKPSPINGGYARVPRIWHLYELYAHSNGNIVINGGEAYLHPDTEVEIVE